MKAWLDPSQATLTNPIRRSSLLAVTNPNCVLEVADSTLIGGWGGRRRRNAGELVRQLPMRRATRRQWDGSRSFAKYVVSKSARTQRAGRRPGQGGSGRDNELGRAGTRGAHPVTHSTCELPEPTSVFCDWRHCQWERASECIDRYRRDPRRDSDCLRSGRTG